MQNGNVKRVTVAILAVSAVFGAGFWYLTFEGAKVMGHRISHKIDSLPHGPRPIDDISHKTPPPAS